MKAETDQPFEARIAQSVPFVGEWLSGKLFGTAGNTLPNEPASDLSRADQAEAGKTNTRSEEGWEKTSP